MLVSTDYHILYEVNNTVVSITLFNAVMIIGVVFGGGG